MKITKTQLDDLIKLRDRYISNNIKMNDILDTLEKINTSRLNVFADLNTIKESEILIINKIKEANDNTDITSSDLFNAINEYEGREKLDNSNNTHIISDNEHISTQ